MHRHVTGTFNPDRTYLASPRRVGIQPYPRGSFQPFPGMVSRKVKGVVKDLEWQKSFVVKAVKYQRDIIPIRVKAENSKFFYNLANFRTKIGLKVNLEMMYLPKETFNKKGSTFTLVIGKPIKWETLDKSKTPKEWAEEIKNIVYQL